LTQIFISDIQIKKIDFYFLRKMRSRV